VLGEGNKNTESLIDFIKVLALCHTVQIDSRKGEYSSASPDELAFVNFAK